MLIVSRKEQSVFYIVCGIKYLIVVSLADLTSSSLLTLMVFEA